MRRTFLFLLLLIGVANAALDNSSFTQALRFNVSNTSALSADELINHVVVINLSQFTANYTTNNFEVRKYVWNGADWATLHWYGNVSRYYETNDTWADCISGSCYLLTTHNFTNMLNITDVYIGGAGGTPEPTQIWAPDLRTNYTGWKSSSAAESWLIDTNSQNLHAQSDVGGLASVGANSLIYKGYWTYVWEGDANLGYARIYPSLNSTPTGALQNERWNFSFFAWRYGGIPDPLNRGMISGPVAEAYAQFGIVSGNYTRIWDYPTNKSIYSSTSPTNISYHGYDTNFSAEDTWFWIGGGDNTPVLVRNICGWKTPLSMDVNIYCMNTNSSRTITSILNNSVMGGGVDTYQFLPANITYNTTNITYRITANWSNASYTCNWTRNGITNTTNFTVVNDTNYSVEWLIPFNGYHLSSTCSNISVSSTTSVIFASRQLLGWVNTSIGTSIYETEANTTYCEAMISGIPVWVNFTVVYPNGTVVHDFATPKNGTNLTATGNWASPTFVANVTGIWNCSVIAFDGTSQIHNVTRFDVIGANSPVVNNITTSRGLSFDFVGSNTTNCTATVDDPDGAATLEWYNFTVTNPVGTKIINNVNGTSDGTWRTSPFFVAGAVGVWTCSVTAYDGLNTQTNSTTFTVTVPAGGGDGGGGGGGGVVIINQTTPEEPEFKLPAATGFDEFLKIVAIAAVILFFLSQSQK